MIERMIAALSKAGFELTDEQIADILWLAVQMGQSNPSPITQQRQTQSSLPEPSTILSQSSNEDSQQSSSTSTDTNINVYPQPSSDTRQGQDSTESSGLPIKVAAAQALRNPLAIARSLRPLKRRVPSRTKSVLDEVATVQRIAEEKLWIPVMRPAPERWFELALVIDEGASMMLWKQTIKEFRQLLEQHGAFRDVRTWGLYTDVLGKVWLRSRTASVACQHRFHNPKELIDPNGRRLLLVISDCVSPAWRSGAITKVLAPLACSSPVAIMQVLPEWLWERSALGLAESVLLRSSAPGVPNPQLTMTSLDLLDDYDISKGLKVPVVTLEPESLGTWARMVAGAGDAQSKGFLLAPSSTTLDDSSVSTESSTASLSAKQRLQRFRLSASPMARRLAGLLAAAPVSLPVVRLIQQTMLPESRQVHVAEVFLGGILKTLLPIDADTDPDTIQYDFIDGVRDLLLDSVPLPKSVEVLREVSKYVTERAGLSINDFTAVLADPTLPINRATGDLQVRPFARLTAQVLKRLGGRYSELAEQLEQRVESSTVISQERDVSKLDLRKFFQATDPGKTLFIGNPEDKKFYIDFSSVRGGKIIEELKDNITLFSPNDPTCVLFTGHIGCGKSTELLRLKIELEQEGFHVVYFESSEDLEMADVDIDDVLLAIARRVSQSLDKITLEEPSRLKRLLEGAWKVLNSEVTGFKLKPPEMPGVPKIGDIGITSENDKFSLAFGIGEITTKVKSAATLREKLNQYLGPQKTQLLEAINQELLEPAIAKLKQQGKNGLVVIVDNLDRIDNRQKAWGRPQQEYLFVDQGQYLTKLNCHVVYTLPLALKFSNDYGNLTQRFMVDPNVLPMVPVKLRDGSECAEGMALLRQMVLARAFPDVEPEDRLSLVSEVFDSAKTLDRLCLVSGGHVRELLRFLNDCIRTNPTLPLTREGLEEVIRSHRNQMTLAITDDEWDLLRQVQERKRLGGDDGYQVLVRSLFVYEYRDHDGSWFEVNPILAEAEKFKA